jgi:hypothetical protein
VVQIRRLVAQRRVLFTLKALRELAVLGLNEEDALDVLAALAPKDLVGHTRSHRTGEWMHVFNLRIGHDVVYLKVIVRTACVIISFPHDEGEDEDR